MAPSGSEDVTGRLRRATQKNIDIIFKLDALVYNLLNDDADLFFSDLRLLSPDEDFIPGCYHVA